MLKRGKVRDAARAVPRKLSSEGEVLTYLHRRANTSRTSPHGWRNHRHGGDREKILDCTRRGFEMRPSRLVWLLAEVDKAEEAQRPSKLAELLWTMQDNSARSERQKINVRQRRRSTASAVVRPPRRRAK